MATTSVLCAPTPNRQRADKTLPRCLPPVEHRGASLWWILKNNFNPFEAMQRQNLLTNSLLLLQIHFEIEMLQILVFLACFLFFCWFSLAFQFNFMLVWFFKLHFVFLWLTHTYLHAQSCTVLYLCSMLDSNLQPPALELVVLSTRTRPSSMLLVKEVKKASLLHTQIHKPTRHTNQQQNICQLHFLSLKF